MDELKDFLDELRRRVAAPARGGVAVASVVRHRGSTPRKAGAKMLVDPAGPRLGTVGGGCGEAEVASRAQRVLATGDAQRIEVSLLEEDGWESPSVCGGVLDVFLERAGDSYGGIPCASFFATLDAARVARRGVAIVSVTEAPRPERACVGRKTLVDERGVQHFPLGEDALDAAAIDAALAGLAAGSPAERTVELANGAWRLFVEPLVDTPELVVVGAGHVGQALAQLASPVGFAVTVIDDRPSFASPGRLPGASRIVLADPPAALAELEPHANRYVVLVTRGHRLDAECLRVALGLDLVYLGMIGSRRRVQRIRDHLAAEGADTSRLARLRAPIGLAIAAETPHEIAVAILAEMIAVRRGGDASRVALSGVK
jgi:xanthine dehydrogenase accessory factor